MYNITMKNEISVSPKSNTVISVSIGNENVYEFLLYFLDKYNNYNKKDKFIYYLNGYDTNKCTYYPYTAEIEISKLFLSVDFGITSFCKFVENKYYLDSMCTNDQDCNDCCFKYICI